MANEFTYGSDTTTFTSYSNTTSQQLVFYNNTELNNESSNSIIFEFTAINVSTTYLTLPLFENVTVTGFPDVSAVAVYPIAASKLNKLFYLDGFDLSNNTVIPEKFGINTDYIFDFSYSNASVTVGQINNTTGTAPTLQSDYVNYLAFAITGGYNLADIFSNEIELLQGVRNMDVSFNSRITTSINNVHVTNISTSAAKIISIDGNKIFFDTSDNNSTYIQGCKSLIEGLLSITNTPRGNTFLDDIAEQSADTTVNVINVNQTETLESFYYVKFHTGDVVSLLLNYVPYNGNGKSIIGDNLVYTRPYKILLKCVSE
jgi:hypothetical protein